MVAEIARNRTERLLGHAYPRVAPPIPARSDLRAYQDTAKTLNISLMPWQEVAARYLEARGPGKRHLYREVAIVVARQNGKTQLLIPLIVKRLLAGQRIMHTAQDRSLPRAIFYRVAEQMWEKHSDLFPMRNGRPTKPRYANGQEEVRLTNGGIYSIVAPTRGGARGPSRDLVIIDELREMDTWDFIAAAKPTMSVSPDPQMLYLSNAGEEDSIVLNAIRDRAASDPALAYLEWSAAPERTPDDREGWVEANPAMGYERDGMGSLLRTMETDYRTAGLESTMALFETEHLCRWVTTLMPSLVSEVAWMKCRGDVEAPTRPMLGINMDPSAKRASAVSAWQQSDGTIAVRVEADVTGDPIDPSLLGPDLKKVAITIGAPKVAYAPWTDGELAKHLRNAKPVDMRDFAAACQTFVQLVNAGRLRWQDASEIGFDLKWAARKMHEAGAFHAVRANEEHPITAVLAAIRAVGLASGPVPSAPRVY
jgi:hypothetical protein